MLVVLVDLVRQVPVAVLILITTIIMIIHVVRDHCVAVVVPIILVPLSWGVPLVVLLISIMVVLLSIVVGSIVVLLSMVVLLSVVALLSIVVVLLLVVHFHIFKSLVKIC